jgi:ribosomal protein S18 acetylase RimI-like enzyme
MNNAELPVIRKIQANEITFLDEMLYQAIFIGEEETRLPRGITKNPELSKYISDFGQESDICFVAEINGILIGAVWTRLFRESEKGYGFVDDRTPELSMAVLKTYRHIGIGTLLLRQILLELTRQDYQQVSLSVDKRNYAFSFYQKFGFNIIGSDEKSAILVKKLKK